MNKTAFRISVLINIILIILMLSGIFRLREYICQKWINYKGEASMVMFGDSHVFHGKWNFLIHEQTVLKKGHNGFSSDQLAGLISHVFYFQPNRVFILCGGNDINKPGFSIQETIQNFKFMADTLKEHNIQPVFHKLIYCHKMPKYNRSIDSLNFYLSEYCADNNIDLIDIGYKMHDSTGLKKSLTTDHIHLNKAGYKLWAAAINDYLGSK